MFRATALHSSVKRQFVNLICQILKIIRVELRIIKIFLCEYNYYEKRDFTVLSTRSENRKEKEFEKVIKYPIPLELNLFHGKRVGFVYGESEKHFLIDLACRNEMVKL